MIRFAQPRDAAGKMRQLLADAGVRSSCSYVVLGEFDGLVRVWMTNALRRRLVRAMARSGGVVVSRTFRASEIYYEWHEKAVNLLDESAESRAILAIDDHLDVIKRTALQASQPDARDVERLLGSGLLLTKPPEINPRVKCLVFLESTDGRPASADLTSRLLELPARASMADTFSIYAGEGDLGIYVLRYSISDYRDVLAVGKLLDELLGSMAVRTVTIPLLESEAGESDNLNNVFELSESDSRIAEVLGISPDVWEQVSRASRGLISELYSEVVQRIPAGSIARTTALDLLSASAQGDRRAITQALAFIVDFEYYFREVATSILAQGWGDDWIQDAQGRYPRTFTNVPGDSTGVPSEWPLGVVHSLLVLAVKDDSYVNASCQSLMGEGWQETVRAILDMRNDFAHGRLVRKIPDPKDLGSAWGKKVGHLLRGLILFEKLFDYVERRYNGVDIN